MSSLVLGWLACAADGPRALVVARGGGAAYWPPDSRTALEGALAAEVEGLEVGIVLTADDVPVLAHTVTLDPSWCTLADGAPLGTWVDLRSVTLDELHAGYACGGVPDPRYDQALVVAEPVATLDLLLDLLHGAQGDLEVRLLVPHEPGRTARPAVTAREVLARWADEDLPQDLVVTTWRTDVLDAFDVEARALGFDFRRELLLVRDEELEAQRLTGQLDYARVARDAGADGVGLGAASADRLLADAARKAGVAVSVRDADDPDALAYWTRPGRADAVVTDWPGDVP